MKRGSSAGSSWPALIAVFLFLFPARPAAGQEWTRFRGPNGSGVSPASTVPARWTAKDYRWKVKLPGIGHSSPVLWGKRVFVTSGEEKTGQRMVLCLAADDGRQLWLREFPGRPHGKHQDNSFASATPAVDDRHVYVCWANTKEYLVIAVDHFGKEAWRADLGPYRSGHGFGASPIIHESLVIVANDQDGASSLVALERGSGKIRWQVPRRSKSTFATPCVFRPRGRPAELIFACYEHGLTSIDPSTGRTNWERDIFSKGHIETTIASPIVTGDLVLGTSGWLGVKFEVVAVRPYPPTQDKVEPVYRLEKVAPLVPTPLIVGELLFLWNDHGVVTCVEAASGKVFWRQRVPGSYYGSPVCAGPNLYCISREGEVVVLAASKTYALRARNPLGEGSHSTPAIAGNTMFVRTFSHLMAVGGKR